MAKQTKKNYIEKSNTTIISRTIPRSKKGAVRIVLIMISIITTLSAIPLPYTFEKTVAIPFATDTQKNASLELGDSKVLQTGREGSKTVTVSSLQSLWGKLFGWQPIRQKETGSIVNQKPTNKIVANGTRKYQYMLCSDGSSRYYTDEQFKDANTGFTSNSSDFCKQNNQGEKLKLADSLDGDVNNIPTPTVAANTPTPRGCTKQSIPHGTEYQNASYLPKGTRQVAAQGMDGFVLHCPGQADVTSSGVDQLILVGTGKTDSEIQAEKDAEEIKKQQEEAARDQQYYLNLANCVRNLTSQGMQPSSAETHCRSIIRR